MSNTALSRLINYCLSKGIFISVHLDMGMRHRLTHSDQGHTWSARAWGGQLVMVCSPGDLLRQLSASQLIK